MRALLLLILSAAWSVCCAQLTDPTVPPDMARQAAPDKADGKPAESAEPTAPRLQTILISPRRRVAVIDGKPVRIGEKVGSATLVSVAATSVVLVKGGAREVLRLYPRDHGNDTPGKQ
jgi:MSHA biogenesis protein MshK